MIVTTSHMHQKMFSQKRRLSIPSPIFPVCYQLLVGFLTLGIRISILYISTGLPVFPSLGNHDIIPKNQYPTPDTSDSWTDYYDQDRFRFVNGIFFQVKSI